MMFVKSTRTKYLLSLLLAWAFVLSLSSACGDDSGNERDDAGLSDNDGTNNEVDALTEDPDAAINETDGAAIEPDAEPGECEGGPLAEPIPGCQPTPVPDTGDMYADCVARINQFRWECQCLPPLDRWPEGESCADEHAEYDSTHGAHAGFQANICSPRGNAQNECPGWGSVGQVLDGCLQMMWDEGPGEPFAEHGHYINMSSTNYNRVACGFYTTAGGSVWAVQNFSP